MDAISLINGVVKCRSTLAFDPKLGLLMKKPFHVLLIAAVISYLALEQKYFLLLFGLFIWIIDLQVLSKCGISSNVVLQTTINTNNLLDILLLLTVLSTILHILSWYSIHLSIFLAIAIIIFYNGSNSTIYKTEFEMFKSSLNRIVFDGLHDAVSFGDVLFADILTSFSKEIGDFVILFRIFFPLENVFVDIIGTILVSLPYTFRLRQTLAEAYKTKDLQEKNRHLANALKYASSYPVIWITFYINWCIKNNMELKSSVVLWIFFSLLNSLYASYWDVFVDWNLFNYEKIETQEFGRSLTFKKVYYIGAILFNTIIRMFWILKISLFMHQDIFLEDTSQLVLLDFAQRILEIFRRGVWIIFRFEREWVGGGYAVV